MFAMKVNDVVEAGETAHGLDLVLQTGFGSQQPHGGSHRPVTPTLGGLFWSPRATALPQKYHRHIGTLAHNFK